MCSLWASTTAGLPGGAEGVRAAAHKLLSCQEELLRLDGQLSGLELEAWVSPAGQAFRHSLLLRRLGLGNAARAAGEAAVPVSSFGAAIEVAAAALQP